MERGIFEPVTETIKRFGRDVLTIMVCPPLARVGDHFINPRHSIPFDETEPWPEPPHWPPPSDPYSPNGHGLAERHEQLKLSYDSEGNYHDDALRLDPNAWDVVVRRAD